MPRSRLPMVLAVGVLAIALGGVVVFQQFLAGDDVARLTLAPSPATFVLAPPIEVPVAALSGATIDVEMTGDLTIHGVIRRVTIPGQTRLNGDRIEVAGSLTFPFADFGMTPPDIAGFVQVEDDATLELLLSLAAA